MFENWTWITFRSLRKISITADDFLPEVVSGQEYRVVLLGEPDNGPEPVAIDIVRRNPRMHEPDLTSAHIPSGEQKVGIADQQKGALG